LSICITVDALDRKTIRKDVTDLNELYSKRKQQGQLSTNLDSINTLATNMSQITYISESHMKILHITYIALSEAKTKNMSKVFLDRLTKYLIMIYHTHLWS
jgi:hypothetical protein